MFKVSDRVRIKCNADSPYNKKKGVIVRLQENYDKHWQKSIVYIVRLDKPHAPWAKEVGFPEEGLERIGINIV